MVLIQTYKYLYNLYHLIAIVHEVYKATYNWPPLCRNHLQPILNDRCMIIGYTPSHSLFNRGFDAVMHGILMDFDGFWVFESQRNRTIYIYIHYIHCNWPRNPTREDSWLIHTGQCFGMKNGRLAWDFSTKPGINWGYLGIWIWCRANLDPMTDPWCCYGAPWIPSI